MSARIHEQRSEGWYRAEIAAPEWLAQLSPHAQVAAAASFESGLGLVLARPLAGELGGRNAEVLRIRAEVWAPDDSQEGRARIDALRDRLKRCAARGALRPAPLAYEPDAHALEALAAACAELEGDPASGSGDIDPELRGFPLYPREDGSFRVALDDPPGLPFVALRAAEEGGCVLEADLVDLTPASPACADAAALAALRAAASARGIGASAPDGGARLLIGASIDAPIEASRLALALCALEHAAIGCARETARLAADAALARRYLACAAPPPPSSKTATTVVPVFGEA